MPRIVAPYRVVLLVLITAVGFADVHSKKPMKADSIFWIASQSKPMTAVAAMMLVDEGKITFNKVGNKVP